MEICPLFVENVNRWPLPSFPVTFGVPLAAGALLPGAPLVLRDSSGKLFPVQSKSLAIHPDGSVRRLLVTAEPPVPGQKREAFSLESGGPEASETVGWNETRSEWASIVVERQGDTLVIERGGQGWRLSVDGALTVEGFNHSLVGSFRIDTLSATDSGPVRLRLDVAGAIWNGTTRLLDVDLVIQIFSRTPVLALDVIATNRTNREPVAVDHLRAKLERLGGEYDPSVKVEVRNGPAEREVELPCAVRTDKLATSVFHGNEEKMRRASRLIGYGETGFSRVGQSGEIVLAIRNFWENYPAGVAFDSDAIEIELFPRWAPPMQLHLGVGKTHEILVALLNPEDRECFPARGLVYSFGKPPLVQVPFEVRARAGTLSEYLPYMPETYPRMETNLFDLFQNRIRGFGKLNWGDDYSPLYTNQKRGGEDVVWNNLEGDHPYHAFCQFARTGQFAYFKDFHDSILHWMDVDFAERHADPRHEGALIAHTRRHVINGGTTPSHNWAEGFKEWYFMTGDPRVERVLNQMADWFLRNKDRELRLPPYVRTWGWGLIQLAAIWEVTNRDELLELMQWMVEQLHTYCAEHEGLTQGFGETPGASSVNAFHSATVAIGAYHVFKISRNEIAKNLCLEVTRSISDRRATSPEGIPTYVNGPEQNFPMQQAATLTLGAIGCAWELARDRDLVRKGMRMLEYCLDRGLQVDHMRIPGQFVEFEDGICLMPELVWPNCQLLSYQLRGILLFMKAAHECGYLKEVDYRF
ncbi:MAG TPA: hypothetical protein PLV10_04695 [Candidatus Latescibacteria bacterium]|nr:hypothetical protein [Candidatus Latescibacterota bacterium]